MMHQQVSSAYAVCWNARKKETWVVFSNGVDQIYLSLLLWTIKGPCLIYRPYTSFLLWSGLSNFCAFKISPPLLAQWDLKLSDLRNFFCLTFIKKTCYCLKWCEKSFCWSDSGIAFCLLSCSSLKGHSVVIYENHHFVFFFSD